jgi:hypothetical protein
MKPRGPYPLPVPDLEIKRHMTADDLALISPLLDAASRADGQRALSDHQWLELVQGGRRGFTAVMARDDEARPIAYAQIARATRRGSSSSSLTPDAGTTSRRSAPSCCAPPST